MTAPDVPTAAGQASPATPTPGASDPDTATAAGQAVPADGTAADTWLPDVPDAAEPQAAPVDAAATPPGSSIADVPDAAEPQVAPTDAAVPNIGTIAADVPDAAEPQAAPDENWTATEPPPPPIRVVTASSATVTFTQGPQHLQVPMQLSGTGSYACVDQDSSADILSCVAVLLRTRVGARMEVPGFGVPDPAFLTVGSGWAGVLEAAVQTYEPRAAGAAIPVQINQDGTATVQVGVPTRPGGPAA